MIHYIKLSLLPLCHIHLILYMQCRNPKRFHWFEWVFLVVATLSMIGVLAIAVYRFVYFENHFINITVVVNESSNATQLASCNNWMCMSDFIFAVALLVNLGEFPFLPTNTLTLCMYCGGGALLSESAHLLHMNSLSLSLNLLDQ